MKVRILRKMQVTGFFFKKQKFPKQEIHSKREILFQKVRKRARGKGVLGLKGTVEHHAENRKEWAEGDRDEQAAKDQSGQQTVHMSSKPEDTTDDESSGAEAPGPAEVIVFVARDTCIEEPAGQANCKDDVAASEAPARERADRQRADTVEGESKCRKKWVTMLQQMGAGVEREKGENDEAEAMVCEAHKDAGKDVGRHGDRYCCCESSPPTFSCNPVAVGAGTSFHRRLLHFGGAASPVAVGAGRLFPDDGIAAHLAVVAGKPPKDRKGSPGAVGAGNSSRIYRCIRHVPHFPVAVGAGSRKFHHPQRYCESSFPVAVGAGNPLSTVMAKKSPEEAENDDDDDEGRHWYRSKAVKAATVGTGAGQGSEAYKIIPKVRKAPNKCCKSIGVASLKIKIKRRTNYCLFIKKVEAAALCLRVCVVKVGGILVQTPTDNAPHNMADKLGKGPAVPVCGVRQRERSQWQRR